MRLVLPAISSTGTLLVSVHVCVCVCRVIVHSLCGVTVCMLVLCRAIVLASVETELVCSVVCVKCDLVLVWRLT